MSAQPNISIVIPSFNQGQYLEEAMDSVFNQEFRNLQVILIDGGSTDGSIDIIQRHSDRLHFWISEKDRGQSEAINKGFKLSTGEWISWLNSDDLLMPGAIEELVKKIERNPELSWWTGGGWFINEKGSRIKHYEAPSKPIRAEDLCPWTNNWFAQPGTFMRRQLFEEAGGFLQEDLHYAMDLDLWLRMARIAPLYGIDYDMAAYRLHDTSKTLNERAGMEVEVVKVLYEHLGFEKCLERVSTLADSHFDLEANYQTLVSQLKSPIGLLRLITKHGSREVLRWLT